MRLLWILADIAAESAPLLALISLRTLPVLAYVLGTARLSLARKAGAASLLAPAMIASTLLLGPNVLHAAAGLLYYVVATCVLYACMPLLRARRVTRGAFFTFGVLAFLVAPAFTVSKVTASAFLIVGFDAALSIYSYCVEHSSRSAQPSLRDCLFFVLVDPTVAFPERSTRVGPVGLRLGGILRLGWGLLGLVFATVVLAEISAHLRSGQQLISTRGDTAGSMAFLAAERFLTEYAKHSALASFQIGLMYQLGFLTPERYRFPLFATSPLDFWRRWNTFVGHWIQRYAYVPSALRFGRTFRSLSTVHAKAAGVLIAFGAAGLLHVVYGYMESFHFRLGWLQWFAFHGLLVVAWFSAGAARARVWKRIEAGVHSPLTDAGCRLCFLAMLGYSVAEWGPR